MQVVNVQLMSHNQTNDNHQAILYTYFLLIIFLNFSISPAQSLRHNHSQPYRHDTFHADAPRSILPQKPLPSSLIRRKDTREPQKSGDEAPGQFAPPV